MKRLVGLLLAAVVAVPAVLAQASPASAATPTCTTVKHKIVQVDYIGSLPATSSGSSTCLLYEGLSNAGVKALQVTLNKCFGEHLAEDGIFGPLTRSALIRAQQAVGTAADGVYGPDTRDRFNANRKWAAIRDILPLRIICTNLGT
ncbi:MAG: peptidoglycan-binding domain-containing protein [Micromonosporaceae bacterium]|jgi:peptidoglycan hydrolase-like protein with peptidoglycan-binding domain